MPEDQPQPRKDPPNWAQRLGQSSAGLPPAHPAPPPSPGETSDLEESRRLWRLAGLGLQFAATTALFFFLGHALDLWLNWPNTAALTGTILAIVGGLYLIIKEGLNANRTKLPKPPRP